MAMWDIAPLMQNLLSHLRCAELRKDLWAIARYFVRAEEALQGWACHKSVVTRQPVVPLFFNVSILQLLQIMQVALHPPKDFSAGTIKSKEKPSMYSPTVSLL